MKMKKIMIFCALSVLAAFSMSLAAERSPAEFSIIYSNNINGVIEPCPG